MNKTKILLIAIIILATALRLYRLDSAPPSLSWDEAAVGYNGWTIANYGHDEYGKFFPLYFRSFGDDKHPVHIYATALSIKLLGLSESSTRLPAAVLGIFNVLLIFFLAKLLFESSALALLAAFFLAVSPYNIHFSRFNHEANFALFFFMLGLTLFYAAVRKNMKFLVFSAASFGIAFLTYHPSKILVPAMMVLLAILYRRELLKDKANCLKALFTAAVFALLVILNPQLLGIARINQTALSKDMMLLDRLSIVFNQYTWHFRTQYLFISGDGNPRLSSQGTGQFYKVDALFLSLGVIYLLYKRSKAGAVLLAWAFLAPLPSALVAEAPHAARAMFMMGSWNLISALGLYRLFVLSGKPVFKIAVLMLAGLIFLFSLSGYLRQYYGEYVQRSAIDWQYGMKQIVEYAGEHPEYPYVFVTDVRSQPYIFFLYYLKTPLPGYLNSVVYNRGVSKSYNTVAGYGRYYFTGWDPFEDYPNKEALYVLTPSQYDGLKYRSLFNVGKVIYYPDRTTAFFIVSVK